MNFLEYLNDINPEQADQIYKKVQEWVESIGYKLKQNEKPETEAPKDTKSPPRLNVSAALNTPAAQAALGPQVKSPENKSSKGPQAQIAQATQAAPAAAATKDNNDEPTEEELREYIKALYGDKATKDSLENIKTQAEQDYENVKNNYSSFREYIIEQIKVYGSTNESKYIRPRQVKSFIRHPSLIGFMR